MPEGPRVSVVIPVHNTVRYLGALLDSLVRQDLTMTQVEIVAVDDGSTDGSEQLLDRWATERSNLRVVHQENSGWPGQPRNRGIDLSSGRYVFFADSDDAFGSRALRRLCDFADAHGSDIVVPRTQWWNRLPRESEIKGVSVDAELRVVFKSLSPHKLFRRAFLDAHGLRFAEGVVRLEDGIFLSRAYLLAGRVSALGDYAYYVKTRRDERDNISARPIRPKAYMASVRVIMANVRELCADAALADDIVLDVYRRKALRRLRPQHFLRYGPDQRRAWVEQIARVAEEHVPPDLQQRLDTVLRLQSEFVRRRDVDALAAIAAAQAAKRKLVAGHRDGRVLLEVPGGDRDVTGLVTLPDRAIAVRGRRLGRGDNRARVEALGVALVGAIRTRKPR